MHTSLQSLGECHCWWTRVSPRAHIAKFYVQLQLIRSILKASKFSVLKFIEIAILWIYYMASLLASSSFGAFVTSLFNFLNYFVWLSITDDGSVLEMRIWSIFLSLFSYCKTRPLHSIPCEVFFSKYMPKAHFSV